MELLKEIVEALTATSAARYVCICSTFSSVSCALCSVACALAIASFAMFLSFSSLAYEIATM